MTRKDYVAVATKVRTLVDASRKAAADPRDSIHELELQVQYATLCNVAYDLALVFADDNPRFARKRFMTACGVPQ